MQMSQDGIQESRADPGRSAELPLDEWDLPLAAADQACKECRRRKAKCNRGIPTCGLCLKYNRHCLYEKHSKTPLTRKHLTEVEARLERAEALLRKARLIPTTRAAREDYLPQSSLRGQKHDADGDSFDFSRLDQPIPLFGPKASTLNPNEETYDPLSYFNRMEPNGLISSNEAVPEGSPGNLISQYEDGHNQYNPLELPPEDDFEWNEQRIAVVESPHAPPSATEDESDVTDGMATLTVDEKQAGYLGVTSGAALLRIMDPFPSTWRRVSQSEKATAPTLVKQPDPKLHIRDHMIDSYFRLFHLSYPIVHEPTFRAQYSEVIPRPRGQCWKVLAYVIAAIGVWTTSTSLGSSDLPLFAHAKSYLNIDFLESGSMTLVQILMLISNYLQKRNKPNSGYNYSGLAVRMAMGLGLHKEFHGWNISPLKMEIRRRVWWSLCLFDVGGTITFSRPMTWPGEGVEVSLPMNINDRDLTAASTIAPSSCNSFTPYAAVRIQASFHIATNLIYRRVISKPSPTASCLLDLDSRLIEMWISNIPPYAVEGTEVPPEYSLVHAIMHWRYRNLRIIMFRPFVIQRMLNTRQGEDKESLDSTIAYGKCLHEARETITAITNFWEAHEHSRMGAWYSLYFLFQAALIPCICLRNSPDSLLSSSWQEQIMSTLSTIQALAPVSSSAPRCYQAIYRLCSQFLPIDNSELEGSINADPNELRTEVPGPWLTEESPQTEMNSVYSMMWPNLPALEGDIVMQDDAWMEFLMGENDNFGLD